MRRPGFFVKKEGIIAENARFEGLTRLKDACRVDVCGCLYGRIGFGAFPPRERVPGVFALCRTAASEGWNAWFPLSGGQGCEAPDAGVLSGVPAGARCWADLLGRLFAPALPVRTDVFSREGRLIVACPGCPACPVVRGCPVLRARFVRSVSDLPGLSGLSGCSELFGFCLSGFCQFGQPGQSGQFVPPGAVLRGRLFGRAAPFCYSSIRPVRPSLSRPAFSVPPGLFLTPVPSVPPVTPVAVCPATFFILPPLGRSAAGVGRGLQTEGKNLGWGNLGGLSGA